MGTRALKQNWFAAGTEPDLRSLLLDDELRLVMRRDGLTPADYWRHIAQARDALRRRAAMQPKGQPGEMSPGQMMIA